MNLFSKKSKSPLMASALLMLILAIILQNPIRTFADDNAIKGQEDAEIVAETIIYADLFTEGFEDCRAELYVNGFPVGRVGGDMQPYVASPIPEFLIDGENRLEVVLGAGPTPAVSRNGEATCPRAGANMLARARIARFIDGEMTGPAQGETLAELRWSGEGEDTLPKVIATIVDLGKQFGEWKWQTAEKLTLDDATVKSATEFIKMIQKNYSECKPEEIAKVAGFKHAEAVRAYPAYGAIDFGEMFIEELKAMADHPKWKPGDLPVEEYDLRLIADGRLIEAIGRDWRPIVRMAEGDFGFPLIIGRIDGEWQILR
jgi:hypothetical protein